MIKHVFDPAPRSESFPEKDTDPHLKLQKKYALTFREQLNREFSERPAGHYFKVKHLKFSWKVALMVPSEFDPSFCDHVVENFPYFWDESSLKTLGIDITYQTILDKLKSLPEELLNQRPFVYDGNIKGIISFLPASSIFGPCEKEKMILRTT